MATAAGAAPLVGAGPLGPVPVLLRPGAPVLRPLEAEAVDELAELDLAGAAVVGALADSDSVSDTEDVTRVVAGAVVALGVT